MNADTEHFDSTSCVLDPSGTAAEFYEWLSHHKLMSVSADAPVCFPDQDTQWNNEDTTVTYLHDWATELRTIVIHAPDKSQLLQSLKTITPEQILQLLDSDQIPSLLHGVKAAAIVNDSQFFRPISTLIHHTDTLVAATALNTLETVVTQTTRPLHRRETGTVEFAAAVRRSKLQMLRWNIKDDIYPGEPFQCLIQTALTDDDWEIRVTAMVCAARHRLTNHLSLISKLSLPSSTREGVSRNENRVLLALRDACLARLGTPISKVLPIGVNEAIDGNLSGLQASIAAFLHSLILPLPDEYPLSPDTDAVTHTPDGPRLSDGSRVAWVPPIPHWVGDDALRQSPNRNTELVIPDSGFYIDVEPRDSHSFPEALTHAQRMSDQLGRTVSLPTLQQLEMALRGPDGRRYPWGANAHAPHDASPWGIYRDTDHAGEWVLDSGTVQANAQIAVGKNFICAECTSVKDTNVFVYRFVYLA